MIYELSQKFYFEAAHTLQREIDAEESRRVHGHTYHAEVTVIGKPDESGMVQDVGVLRKHIDCVKALLDHRLLDDVDGLGAATLENICAFIFAKLVASCPTIRAVSVERRASGDKCRLIGKNE